jgi:hypothetical protein
MTKIMSSDTALRVEAMHILMKYLGAVNTERFITSIKNDHFYYTEMRALDDLGGVWYNLFYRQGVMEMQSVKAVYDGMAFVPVSPVRLRTNQTVMIKVSDEINVNPDKNSWKKFIGALSHETCAELNEILKDTEKVDANEW